MEEGAEVLDPFEIRVLAVLAEKEALTPDNYPMSLNALVNGCNQLSSRDPVMALSEETVADVLQRLMQRKYVNGITQAGARDQVRAPHAHQVVAGAGQAGRADRADAARPANGRRNPHPQRPPARIQVGGDVELALQFLIDKYPPLVSRLALAPGTKEPRYGQLLGEDALAREETAASLGGSVSGGGQGTRIGALEQEVQQLRQQVEELTAQFAEFRKQFE
jgi:uncharacterized protein YceH (UPF0502 family)